MTSKTNLALFSMLAISALMTAGFVGQEALATSVFTFQIPMFEDWTKVQKDSTYRSYVSQVSYALDDEGKAKLYAKDRSNVQFPQASIEYTKQITIQSGDTLDITQKTYLTKASFYKQDAGKESHVVALPTIHKVGESSTVGYTNQSGCDSKPSFVEITSYTTNRQLTSTLSCDGLSPGTYEISAYVHARANENAPSDNASVTADVKNIELSIKRTR